MTRLHTGVLLALLGAALSTGVARAQLESTPVPESTPTLETTPAPTPYKPRPEYYLAGDALFSTNSKNELIPSDLSNDDSSAARIGAEMPIGKIAVMAEGNYDNYYYYLNDATALDVHNTDWDGRVGIGLQNPQTFFVVSYDQRQNNYGYPDLQGFGYGFEKLANFNQKLSFFGSYLLYPQFGSGTAVQYGMFKYQVGVEMNVRAARVPGFVEIGYMGDHAYDESNAPDNYSDDGLFAGLGIHF